MITHVGQKKPFEYDAESKEFHESYMGALHAKQQYLMATLLSPLSTGSNTFQIDEKKKLWVFGEDVRLVNPILKEVQPKRASRRWIPKVSMPPSTSLCTP